VYSATWVDYREHSFALYGRFAVTVVAT